MNRTERIERVLRRMAAVRIDTLIAFSNAKHHLARTNLAAHLMGYRALGESALVLRGDGSQRLIVTPGYDAERAALRRPELPLTAGDENVERYPSASYFQTTLPVSASSE